MSHLRKRALAASDRRQRSEGGFTFIELLIVVAIGGLIGIPLLTWMALGIRVEHQNSERSAEDNGSNVARNVISRDVATSSAVSLGGTDCVGGKVTETVLLTVTAPPGSAGSERNVVYAIVTGPRGDGQLYRRACALPGSPIEVESRVAPLLVEPTAGWNSIVTCGDRVGRVDDTCGGVTMSLPFKRSPTTVRASRRVGVSQ